METRGFRKFYKIESKLNFGKYKGKTLLEVVIDDPDYIEWSVKEIDQRKNPAGGSHR